MSVAIGQSNAFVIEDVLIFDGKHFTENGHIIVSNGKIEKMGSGKAVLPGDTLRYSKPGCTIIPGLIDAHVHAVGGNVHSIEQSIRFGVTTILDLNNEVEHNVRLKKLASDPSKKGKYADFKCAGIAAMVEGGWPAPAVRKILGQAGHPEIADALISSWPKLASADEAPGFVQSQIDQSGASYIKLMHELGDTLSMPDLPRPPLDIQKAVVEAAHERGIIAVGHALSHAGAIELLEAGVDGLAHCFLDKAPNEEWIRTMREKNIHCSPTLSLGASMTGQGTELQRRFAEDPLSKRMQFDPRPKDDASIENVYENTRSMYRAGVPLVVGSDALGQETGSAFGLGVHMEIYQLVHEVGMRPEEALSCATSVTAGRFGFTDREVIENGRLADLVLLDGDVRTTLGDENVLCLPVSMVWREGVPAEVFKITE
ncbi:hypothetical protein KVR01_007996 [Diaporthe batatas]|uniref:uncharacterized protein n=1 Tax=Diaporthe batatas TaxID=748121 RepID=UPI001D0586A7|nr:uncharacterized protein KVR01_007996 [Diaporthe batatas]KAG8162231.1 hypothetical protein KVR01_007996 [Diaporthe batatas]